MKWLDAVEIVGVLRCMGRWWNGDGIVEMKVAEMKR